MPALLGCPPNDVQSQGLLCAVRSLGSFRAEGAPLTPLLGQGPKAIKGNIETRVLFCLARGELLVCFG